MFAIVGLGNPGKDYAETRHNLGFMAINKLSKHWNIPTNKKKFESRIGEGIVKNQKIMLIKPATFMNNSGSAVMHIVNFYKLEPNELLIIYDDIDLKLGTIRIRTKGSSGGHKGLADIINKLGTDQIPRIRIGIGKPEDNIDTIDYVLSKFTPEEKKVIDKTLEHLIDAVEYILDAGYQKAMDKFNKKEQIEQNF